MSHRPDRRWFFRRDSLTGPTSSAPNNGPWGGRLAGSSFAPQNNTLMSDTTPDPLAELKAEPPGPDGVRAKLVARVRELIAEGAYDTPDRWAAAQDRLFDDAFDSR